MNSRLNQVLELTLLSFTAALFIWILPSHVSTVEYGNNIVPGSEKSISDRAENSQDRRDHFFRLTRNPLTNSIPKNIRERELKYAKGLETSFKYKSSALMEEIDITEVGPNDVGGRTRGLGVDVRNSNIILAGAASGGMWKTSDGGQNWTQTSDPGENLGVTSLIQDPGNLNTWYYSTGEFSGGSARARGGGGSYYGSGIYVSDNNGDSWSQISATEDDDVSFNSPFDFISRVEISPTTGTGFFASNAIGIFRSTNNFNSNSLVLGGSNDHIFSDVQVAENGTVIAAISNPFTGFTATNSPGVYISKNDGQNWTDVTPASYPSEPGRAVIGTSKSAPNIFYVFVAGNSDQPSLYKFDVTDINNVFSNNLTDNIPDFGGPVGDLNLQGGYNMVCEVHPTNSNLVLIGGTNLFRSFNGFATAPDDSDNDGFSDPDNATSFWIGGYDTDNDISQYPNHHPDQHAVIFDPNSPNRVISSHDGGISVTTDISSNSTINWQELNNGYNVTQFYTVTLHPDANDERILGGTQDNGSPFFEFSDITGTSSSFDISSGDGAYAYLGSNFLTTSSQRGRLIKYDYNGLGEPTNFSYIAPLQAQDKLFIHPYLVNHTNEDVIFYPGGNQLYRNNSATSLQTNQDNTDGTAEGWTELSNLSTADQSIISTLEISTTNPNDFLYYAEFNQSGVPRIFRLFNASTTTTSDDLKILTFTPSTSDSIPPSGAYIHDIAVSEDNGNEVIAIVSNYSTESIYYSTNGGNTWTGSGGNLEPSNGNGPSVRSAVIAKTSSGEKTYFVGTSTGLYATNNMDGANTQWKLQGVSTIGNSVVEYLDYRPSDKTLAIATHGRGIFLGNTSMSVSNENVDQSIPEQFSLNQNYPNPFNPSTTISYSLPSNSNVTVSIFDINGRKVAELINNSSQSAGKHLINFNASNLASGVYLYKISAKTTSGNTNFSQIKRMTLIK